mmetsp:Transcript_1988/g.4724  ORF Transcript_1988/g.4724 Transcript_1988/m.4724 type:complete len:133 (+) Transcript_1988:994-1392(+)
MALALSTMALAASAMALAASPMALAASPMALAASPTALAVSPASEQSSPSSPGNRFCDWDPLNLHGPTNDVQNEALLRDGVVLRVRDTFVEAVFFDPLDLYGPPGLTRRSWSEGDLLRFRDVVDSAEGTREQ